MTRCTQLGVSEGLQPAAHKRDEGDGGEHRPSGEAPAHVNAKPAAPVACGRCYSISGPALEVGRRQSPMMRSIASPPNSPCSSSAVATRSIVGQIVPDQLFRFHAQLREKFGDLRPALPWGGLDSSGGLAHESKRSRR